MKPEDWWDDVPGLMALYPLCRHGRAPREAIRHAADAITRTVSVEPERLDRLFLLSIFAGLAYPRLDVERILGSDVMIRESKLVRKIRNEARLEQLHSDLLLVLRGQFGNAAAAELAASVNAVNDLDLLEQLLQQAINGVSLEAFRAALASQRR